MRNGYSVSLILNRIGVVFDEYDNTIDIYEKDNTAYTISIAVEILEGLMALKEDNTYYLEKGEVVTLIPRNAF